VAGLVSTLMDTTVSRMGDTPKRREDARFLTGQGRYLDDIAFPGAAHAVVLRSPHAHAELGRIDAAAARAMPGVLAVLTAAEAAADGLKPLRPTAEANTATGEPFIFAPQPLLAEGKVRYVGEPVALIVAETLAQAQDAADAVEVDYRPLPAVVTAEAARAAGAVQVSAEVPGNCVLDWRVGDIAEAEAAFAQAAHTVALEIEIHRIHAHPMEPRGAVAFHDAATGDYTVHLSHQNVHTTRNSTAPALGVAPEKLRFVAPDVGGGFGMKNFAYPELALLPWAAKRLGRPVKWIATRGESLLSDHPARDHLAQAALALDRDGRFLALRIDSVANLGAYLSGGSGAVQTFQYIHLQGSLYAIPWVALRVGAVLTNTAPLGVTRAPGFAEAINIVERLIDAAARQCGFDRAELRRLNMVPAAAMPMTNRFGNQVDSGRFRHTFDRALARADVDGFAARRRASEAEGKLRGLGFACHIKGTGGSPHENAEVRFESDGTVSLIMGTQTIGQGHETTMPQILAHRMGLANARIRLVHGDTAAIVQGGGHGSSRSTYMGGTAIWRAADAVIAKGKRVAAGALEVAEADIGFDEREGVFRAQGSNRAIGLIEVAALAARAGAPLDSYHFWTREQLTYPNGTHVAEVEIERDTGRARLARFTAVDDIGAMVNPTVAAGQAHGAIVHGIGHALLEHAVYDRDSGQLVAGSLMDYALARADDLVAIDLTFDGTPCTTNPLGTKGVGEAGMVGAYPAVTLAVLDALAPFGVRTFRGPATAERLWRAMTQGGQD